MSMCDRCRVSGCLLDYNGKACKNARKKECPDVVFTNADFIQSTNNEDLAWVLVESQAMMVEMTLRHFGIDYSFSEEDKKIVVDEAVEWLQQPWEEE